MEKNDNTDKVDKIIDKTIDEVVDEYDLIIKRLNLGNSENVKYDFEWIENNDLKYVTDDTLELAYKLIEKGKISIKANFSGKEKNIEIESYIASFCGDTKYNMHTEELLDVINTENKEYSIFYDTKSVWSYSVNSKGTLTACRTCKYQKCPKVVAAYVLYLKNTGKLKEKLEERKKFREGKNINKHFEFTWENDDGLKKVSEEMFNFCNELVNKDYVDIWPVLVDGYMRIESKIPCEEYRIINSNIENIPLGRTWESYKILTRKPTTKMNNFCNTISCRLEACPYVIAGYIYYLKKEGKEEQIAQDRKYYAENKEKIDLEIKQNKLDKIEKIETDKIKKLDIFNEYKENVKNLEILLENITASYQKNLHCIILRKR